MIQRTSRLSPCYFLAVLAVTVLLVTAFSHSTVAQETSVEVEPAVEASVAADDYNGPVGLGTEDSQVRPYLGRVRVRDAGAWHTGLDRRAMEAISTQGEAIQTCQMNACSEETIEGLPWPVQNCFMDMLLVARCDNSGCRVRQARSSNAPRPLARCVGRAVRTGLESLATDLDSGATVTVRIPMLLATGSASGSMNPCPLPGSVPCGTVDGNPSQLECCNPGERCGDGTCHMRSSDVSTDEAETESSGD